MQNDIIFVVTLFIMMLATLPVVHFRSRINSFISQDPELTSKFATALSKRSIALIVLGWNTFLIFFAFKMSDSIELKKLTKKLILSIICLTPLVIIVFGMVFFFYN